MSELSSQVIETNVEVTGENGFPPNKKMNNKYLIVLYIIFTNTVEVKCAAPAVALF